MDDIRAVPVDAEQADLIEEIGLELLRAKDYERGHKLLALHLAWRVCPQVGGADLPAERPAAARPHMFLCDPDESGGLAKPGRPVDASSAQGNPTHSGEPSTRLRETSDPSRPGNLASFVGVPALDPWSRRV